MATSKFIPQIWSARILEHLDKALVYGDLFNRDYEGDISNVGDTVHIGMVTAPTIKSYTKGQAIAAPDAVTAEDQSMVIDQADYFNIGIDDVDKVQSAVDLLDGATSEAGKGFAQKTDRYLGGLLASKGKAINEKTAIVTVTKDNAYQTLLQMKTALDKADCPQDGRIVVVPPEFEQFMLLDSRFVQVGTDASNERLEAGTVYKAAGFVVKVSNNCPTGADGGSGKSDAYTDIVATTPVAATFAEQILKTEAFRPADHFMDAVKGLHVYGAAVTRPEVVSVAHVAF